MEVKRRARRKKGLSELEKIVQDNHTTMTAKEMSAKFGSPVSSFNRAARRLGLTIKGCGIRYRISAKEVVLKHHKEMTVYDMQEKFGFNRGHLFAVATEPGVKIKAKQPVHRKVEKPLKVVTPRVKVLKPKPIVQIPLKKDPVKPRKGSVAFNPDCTRVKQVDYSKLRMIPLGVANQYFYVSRDATPEEIAMKRAEKIQWLENKEAKERLKPLK